MPEPSDPSAAEEAPVVAQLSQDPAAPRSAAAQQMEGELQQGFPRSSIPQGAGLLLLFPTGCTHPLLPSFALACAACVTSLLPPLSAACREVAWMSLGHFGHLSLCHLALCSSSALPLDFLLQLLGGPAK